MGVRIDEAREQGAAVRIDDFAGAGRMLSGEHRRDAAVADLHLSENRLPGRRFRKDQSVSDNNRSCHQRIAFASCPRVAHRSSWPNSEKEITPRTARITIATNKRSVRNCVAEVMMR